MSVPTRERWSLLRPPTDFVLGHVRAVMPDRVLDDARIAVREGRIAEVSSHPGGSGADVDGGGAYCLPGLVDVHSDGLERERMPRPGAAVPWRFALLSFEGKLRAAGITTVFHGAAFEESDGSLKARSVEVALELCHQVADRGDGPVDHRVLHRLDVRSAGGLAALQARLAEVGAPAVVSHEDHTPGQGQYADRTYYEKFIMGTRGLSAEEARAKVDAFVEAREANLDVRDAALSFLGGLARAGEVRLLGHDPASAAEIAALADRGGAVAEFPTTVEAAVAARDRGMPVVMGAPNALRGSSHSGNASARDLVARGLVTALASDYLPSGLLAAPFLLAADGVTPLPAAVRLVTGGAAETVGLPDRGTLTPGARADLVLAEAGQPWPVVRAVLRAEGPAAEPTREWIRAL